MSKIFVTSDTHWHHSNLCTGTTLWKEPENCRNFNTVEEHDGLLLENINSAIQPEDTLFHLGDFTVGSKSGPLKLNKSEAYVYFRNKINCKNIIYIRGNHSLKKQELRELGIFSSVHDYLEITYNKKLICMFHYPIHSWIEMAKGSFHLFAHEHSGRRRGRSMDVGLDGNNFKPWLLDDVIELLKQQPSLKEGHHN